MNEENKPGYYAVIPSQVRYCEELKYAERLLYGEITSLLNKEGYCFATNRYFADLYNVIPGTVSRWISHLEKLGFIKVNLIKNNKNEVIQRRIYVTDISCRDFMNNTYEQNKQYPYKQFEQYPMSRKAKENNINIRIDRLFNYIINKPDEILREEFSSKKEYNDFFMVLERLEMNYTKEVIPIFTKDNLEKIKTIIYAIKEIVVSDKREFIEKIDRQEIIDIYDNCKKIENENKDSEKKIRNFFDYYYKSLINYLKN